VNDYKRLATEAARRSGLPLLLRERLRALGPRQLSDPELLSLLLVNSTSTRPLPGLAQDLLDRIGSLEKLASLEAAELEGLPGVGPALSTRLLAAFELGRRAATAAPLLENPLRGSRCAARYFRAALQDGKREEFHAIYLDTKHRVLGARLISLGSLSSSIVHPREVFRPAIRLAASACLVGHNHPSGDPDPSQEDQAVTRRLEEVGRVLGIPLLDHIILGGTHWFSIADGRDYPFDAPRLGPDAMALPGP